MGKAENIDWIQGLSRIGGGSPIAGLVTVAAAGLKLMNAPFSIKGAVGVGGKNTLEDAFAGAGNAKPEPSPGKRAFDDKSKNAQGDPKLDFNILKGQQEIDSQ